MRDRENLNCPARNRPKIRHNNRNSCDSGLNWEKNSVQEDFSSSPNKEGSVDSVDNTRELLPKIDDFKYIEKELNLNEKNVLWTNEDNTQDLRQNNLQRKMKLETRICNLARERDISLRMFKNLAQRKYINKIEKTVFETACLVLIENIKAYELPRFVKNKKHLQQMLDGKFFLIKGEPGFENLANQDNVKYGGIVYIIRPIKLLNISESVLTEIYLGVTWKTLIERFIEHTEDAIESYLINFDWPSRLIEYLILKALETHLSETCSYDSEIPLINNFIENKLLGKEKWQRRTEINKIATVLYNTYFHMEVIEAHRNYETAWSRETWNIKNYPQCINGKTYQGTLYPNGLNMVTSPTAPGYQTLPLYDILFLISLGYNGIEINKLIREHYHVKINYRTIYSRLNKFWKNWDNILEKSFKLILQALLEEEIYQWKEIAKALRRDPSYRCKKNFRKWFFGLNVTQLRHVTKIENFDWNNLGEVAMELKSDLFDQNTVKGIPVDVWIEWFIKDIGMVIIARMLEYKNVESFRSAWIKQGRVSVFQKKFGSGYSLAVKKYRKKRTIELLTDEDFLDSLLDSKLYWIYVNKFGFMRWENLAVDRPSQGLRNCKHFFNTLFKKEGLTVNDLENLTAFNYMEDQKIYDAVMRISNS